MNPTTLMNLQAPPAEQSLVAQPAQEPTVKSNEIRVDPAEWAKIQAKIQDLELYRKQREAENDEAQNAAVKAMAEKGQIEAALAKNTEAYQKKLSAAQERAKAIESKWLGEKVANTVRDALAGRSFSGADPNVTAKLLANLLTSEIEGIVNDDGSAHVIDKTTRRAASDYLTERLQAPELQIFFAATHKGGSGADATKPSPKPDAAGRPGGAEKTQDERNQEWAKWFLEQKNKARNGMNL